MNRHTAPRSTSLKTHPATSRALGAFVATAIVVVAASLSPPAMAMPGGHGGMQHAGMHGGGMQGGGMMGSPKMAERMLDSVNATPEQRTQIRQLMEAAKSDMQAQRESGRTLREQAAKLFAEPTVDARAAETLRQQMLAQHDTASKRMTQLMLDVSRVLTPEQRKQMAERMAQRRTMMERHRQERQTQRPQS
jgi:Spy/CpxP family protein refolding chaperone